MTPDLRALENHLLLPLHRAASDAAKRLGMTLDPDRELPAGETSGGAAAVVATDGSAAASVGQQVSGTTFLDQPATPVGWPVPRAAHGSQPQAPAAREAGRLHALPSEALDRPGPAQPAPVTTPDAQPAPVQSGLRSPRPCGGRHPEAFNDLPQGPIEVPANRGARPDLAVASRVHSPDAAANEASPVPIAADPPEPRLAAQMPLSAGKSEPGRSGEPSAAPQAMVLRFSTAREHTVAVSPSLAGPAEQPLSEAPLRTPFSAPLRTEPGQQPSQGWTAATTVRSGVKNAFATASMPSPARAASASSADASPAPTAHNLHIASGDQAALGPPDEPFGGMIPVRPLARPPRNVDHAIPRSEELPHPTTLSPFFAHPALGEVARAVRPILSQATGLAEAAWDEEAPAAAAPSISNTFNVTVAMAGSSGSVEREALQDALTDLLRDAARRQGLDL